MLASFVCVLFISSKLFHPEKHKSYVSALFRLCLTYVILNGSNCLVVSEPSPGKKQMDWNCRMRIAAGAARGLEYLHDRASPPVIYRDLKCSNILLDEDYHPKLSDFGLAKLGPVGDNTHVSTRVMGTYGYCAPEYAMTGQLTLKSDVYSFGVVLLEIITGRKAIDNSRAAGEQNLVAWVRNANCFLIALFCGTPLKNIAENFSTVFNNPFSVMLYAFPSVCAVEVTLFFFFSLCLVIEDGLITGFILGFIFII